MRDIVSCFNENAISVSHASCSSYAQNACLSPGMIPALQNAVASFYRVILSTHKQLLITVTWFKNHAAQDLTIGFGTDSSATFKLTTGSRCFRKKKGSKAMESEKLKIEVIWDLSSAKYDTGPEPSKGFYILVTIDSEIALFLGDLAEEALSKSFKMGPLSVARFHHVSRQEYYSGNTLYSTKAKFSQEGNSHDILIRFSGENEGFKCPILSVYFDRKMVIKVKRLQWNFRGNQTIFVDGLLVDLMWDVHDWFYKPSSGNGVFLFRTRSGMDSRLWLEEKTVQKDEERVDFSLIIYACKSP